MTATHPPCDEIITLREKVSQMEKRETKRDADIERLLAMASKFELLMSLSLGGGGLSILSGIILIVSIITKGF